MIEFTVPTAPVAKARARSTRSGLHYTPKKTVDFESMVAWHAREAMAGKPLYEGALCVSLYYGIPIPKTLEPRIKRGELIFPTKRPDMDNYEKSVLDAMNGVVYKDDSQIVATFHKKRYSRNPRVVVSVDVATKSVYSVFAKVFYG
jgi:Holliday junction resolvase RusA-like endonuclease